MIISAHQLISCCALLSTCGLVFDIVDIKNGNGAGSWVRLCIEGMSLGILIVLSRMRNMMRILCQDLEQLSWMEIGELGTERCGLSFFGEISDLQIELLHAMQTVRTCKSFLPDSILAGLRDSEMAVPAISIDIVDEALEDSSAIETFPLAKKEAPDNPFQEDPVVDEICDIFLQSPRNHNAESPSHVKQLRRLSLRRNSTPDVRREFRRTSNVSIPNRSDSIDAGRYQPPLYGMKRRKGTVMLAEYGVRDFIEQEGDEDVYLLSSTLTSMVVDIVRANCGSVLHMTADSLTASWNTQSPESRHSFNGCRSAISIRTTIEEAVTERTERVAFSVSVVSGVVYCGIIGNETHRSPFILGDLVHRARHLNNLSGQIKAPLLISESVQDSVRTQIRCRPVDAVFWTPDSKVREVVYELLTPEDKVDEQKWKNAFHCFLTQGSEACAEKFSNMTGEDEQLERLRRLLQVKGVPVPYARSFRGWDKWDDNFDDSQSHLNCEHAVFFKSPLIKRKSNLDKSLSSFRRCSRAARKSISQAPGDNLLIAIQEVQRTESAECLDDSDDNRCSDDPPTQFIEGGSLWRRSERLLGKGAFGDVWLGMSEDGALVALKVLKVPLQARKRFRGQDKTSETITSVVNEVEMLSKYRDDSIVSFISCGVHDRHVIIVMEYVSGGSISTVLETFGAIKPATAKRYTKDIIRGLNYLHGEGIVHRDLKPGNVLLHTDGQCKLSDFGTCTRITSMASGQEVCGTPLYMAPEVCRGEPCKSSDLWALGLTVIQMLQNLTPFQWAPDVPETPFQFMRWLGKLYPNDNVPIPDSDGVTLDSCAHSFVKRLLVCDKNKRGSASSLLFDPFVI